MKLSCFIPAFLIACWSSSGLVLSFLCPPCNRDRCAPAACKVPGSAVYDECGCCQVCGKLEGELCGGNSNVGGTCAPGLYCSYRLGSISGSQRLGKCEPVICRGHTCGYRQSCSNATGRPTCSCPTYKCSGKNNPVCGNNGRTYQSVCSLEVEECGTSKFIGIRQEGECPQVLYGLHRPRNNTNPFCNIPNVMDHVVNVGEVLQDDPSDPCHYLACYAQQVLAEVTVPGCIDGPVEPDYGVTQLLVNGGWTAWEDVSECSGTCPSGTVIQRRNCTNPPPSNEGNYCLGSSTRNASCEPKQCRVDELCGYGAWSNWSSCSVTCGTGVQTRNRTADVQPAAIVPCSHLEEARTCKMATCVTSGNCRLRKTLQLLPGEGADSNCITPEPQRVARECRGTCQGGSSCVPTFQTHSYNMSCPDGFRAVPARIVVLCSCQ